MSDTGPDSPSGGGLWGLIQAINVIAKAAFSIQTTLANAFVNLAQSNTFTAPQSFQSGLILKGRVITAAGAVTVAASDFFVTINKTVGAATAVSLPASPAADQIYTIKDGKGDAGANNITITPAAGNIDGGATLVISTNYGVARLYYSGAQWYSW